MSEQPKWKFNQIDKTCPKCNKAFRARKERVCCSKSCSSRKTWESIERRGRPPATCHPDRPHEARGLCANCYQKKITDKKPDRRKKLSGYNRKRHLKKKFGLTVEQWDRMFERQGGLCPICESPILRPGESEKHHDTVVDHDHITGKVRGLTHWQCNIQLISTHTLDTARKLVHYLEQDFDGRKI